MLLLWLLRGLIPHYNILVNNPATGAPSGKNVFATLSFVVGIGGAIVSVAADIAEKRPVGQTAILLLLGNGSLLAGLKVYQQQANRKTQDEDGALVKPIPPAEEPKLMPQAGPLAGYSDGPNSTTRSYASTE